MFTSEVILYLHLGIVGSRMKEESSVVYIKDLLVMLTIKELKSRYKSTSLGFLWAFINPLLQMIIMSIVFKFFFRIQVENYSIFLFSGLLPWMFFNLSLSGGTSVLVDNRDLLKKVVFPREILPLSAISANFVNFLASMTIFLIVLIILGFFNFSQIVFLPVAIILQLVLTAGIVFLTSSLNIVYRDVSYIIQAGLILWFYASPIFYPLSFVPQKFIGLYSLNPMVGIIGLYHFSVLGQDFPPINTLAYSFVFAVLIFIIGIKVFEMRKKNFADYI